MFTRCPNCRQQRSLTAEQLRVSRAIVFCRRCSIKFDALELLSDTASDEVGDIPLATVLPWERQRRSPYWKLGLAIGIVLLLAQIVYFEGNALTQNTRLRPGLATLCRDLGCRLPDYKNPDELIVRGTLTPSGQHYVVTGLINNQAAFAQAYPDIKLTLLDYSGNPFAHRVFQPRDYAASITAAKPVINAGATLAIHLDIAATQNPIGGYTFDILN